MIKLEAFKREDFNKLLEWNENKTSDFLLQWAGPLYRYPLTEEQIKDYFENYVEKESAEIFVYKIINISTGYIIGTIELSIKDKDSRVGRVGRFLIGEETSRGKNYGRAALNKVLKIGFEELDLNKITLGVFDFNKNAISCYESVGFKIEGLKENYRKAESGYWNLYDMGITYEEWKARSIVINNC